MNKKYFIEAIVKNSGWYDEICKILSDLGQLKDLTDSSYPLYNTFFYEGVFYDRVRGSDIKEGAILLLHFIKGEVSSNVLYETWPHRALYHYLWGEKETLMHNYAVSRSHRVRPDEGSLDRIRQLSIICSLLDHINMREEDFFEIPEGWKRKNSRKYFLEKILPTFSDELLISGIKACKNILKERKNQDKSLFD